MVPFLIDSILGVGGVVSLSQATNMIDATIKIIDMLARLTRTCDGREGKSKARRWREILAAHVLR
jgi:hypothetical protein